MMGDLTQNFSRAEFACQDHCGYDAISLDLVNRLQVARRLAGIPIKINSGCRCQARNSDPTVGGLPNSAHLTGLAADLACRNSHTRYLLLLGLYSAGIERIKLYSSWIHVDIDETKPQEICAL